MTENLPEVARPLSPAEVSWKVAQKIANTPFVPTAFRGKPESVYAAVLYGEELGLGLCYQPASAQCLFYMMTMINLINNFMLHRWVIVQCVVLIIFP